MTQGRQNQRRAPRTYARRGTAYGAFCGLLLAFLIISQNIDFNATEHKGIFPAAVMILCGFSVIVFFVCTLVGGVLGSQMLRSQRGVRSGRC